MGRLATFLVILAASLVIARTLVGRHRDARDPLGAFSRLAPPLPRPSPVAARPAVSATPPVAPRSQEKLTREITVPTAAPVVDPLSDALCPEGMLLVEGVTCGEASRTCLARDADEPRSCKRYAASVCRKGLPVRVCMDQFEYPNLVGMSPAALVTFEQAKDACTEEGKRLCTETEWSFACEGGDGLAFPYGDIEDASACNVLKAVPKVRADSLWEARDIPGVMERVDARSKIGQRSRCTSSLGIRDMVGNVEEWVKSDIPGFESALRGGEYSSDPSCRTVRQIRQPAFRTFDTGFRCCRDPLVSARRLEREDSRPGGPTVAPPGGFD